MTAPALDILLISDLHYARKTATPNTEDSGHGTASAVSWEELAPALLGKAMRRLRLEGIEPGLLVVLGDALGNGSAPGAEDDLVDVVKAANRLQLPVLAVPGNHDVRAERFALAFGSRPGVHEFGGYTFLLFNDRIGEGDVTTRPAEALAMPSAAASEAPDAPLIALQHNPLHPRIEGDYPYMLTNGNDVLDEYARAKVLLSLSGHYHVGQPAVALGPTTYYTVPAVCESPYRFAHVRLRGARVDINEYALALDTPGLMDVHCHTEYAYCASSVAAAPVILMAREMGLHGQCFAEHAFQLYFNFEDAWSWRWQTDDRMVQAAWQERQGRMAEFRRFADAQRSDYVRIALEVDLRADGTLLLADEDREAWDYLIGSVHNIPGLHGRHTTRTQAEGLFLHETERLLSHPIQVLGHPFRFFRRAGLPAPRHLYGRVADMLAQAGVAAEVNFHTNDPDPRFIEECLSRGVRIALGSDAHAMEEVGDFRPHLRVLKQAGVDAPRLESVLWRPR